MNKIKKLKLLMITASFSPSEGGSKTVVLEISKRLVKRGYEVSVLTARHFPNWANQEDLEGIHVVRYSVNSTNGISYYVSSIFNAKRTLERLIKKNSFDLMHFHITLPSIGVLLSRKARAIPKIYTYHGSWCQEFRLESQARASRYRNFKKNIYMAYTKSLYHPMRLMQRMVVRKSLKTIVLSEYSKGTLLRDLSPDISPSRIILIPGGVDTERFKPPVDKLKIKKELGLCPDKFTLFTVRRLVPRMGLEELIHAMKILVEHFGDIHLIIGGRGILESQLKRLTRSLRLRKYVTFTGYIDEKKLPLYYQAADVFVLPTKDLEGFGLVTIEALACGTLVLATPVGANPEILKELDKNLLFTGVDAQSMAKRILEFMSSHKANNGLSEKYRKFAIQNYSWDRIVDRYEETYFAVVDRKMVTN